MSPASRPAVSRSIRDRSASARCARRAIAAADCARVNPAPAGLFFDPSGGGDDVSGKVTGWVLRYGPADRTQLGVLVVLADAARNDGTGIRLSVRDIATRSRLSRSHAAEVVRVLVADRWVRRIADGRAPGCPSEYEIPLPQPVDKGSTVRSRADGTVRPRADGTVRPRADGFRNEASSLGRYGSNGSGSPVRNGSNGRRSTGDEAAEAAAIAGCDRCDDAGWVFAGGNTAARCDHRPATGSRRAR